MNRFDLAKAYKNKGYCNLKGLFDNQQVEYLRKAFEKTFSKKEFPTHLSLFDIEDKEAIKIILEVFNSEIIQSAMREINKYSNTKISVLPPFEIQRNYHVDVSKTLGWHRDCGGELAHKYCTKKLCDKSYVFGKIGIYLQENGEYGGSIDLIPYSHRYFDPKKKFIRKLKGIPLFFIKKLHSYFRTIYRFLPEKFYMNSVRAKKIFPQIGSPVLFDSRIIHRGSPIDEKVRNQVRFFPDKTKAELPKTKTKYSVYTHFGSSIAVDSYMFDRLKRDDNSSELRTWWNEQKEVEKFFPNLALSIKDIMHSVLSKYNQYL
mgnify:CR=1 FL=1